MRPIIFNGCSIWQAILLVVKRFCCWPSPEPDPVVVPVVASASGNRDVGRTAGTTSDLEPGPTIAPQEPEPDMREEEDPQHKESDTPELLSKHKIFLSHSGVQKPFVEQLCVDLENAGHFPFFDQRPESLPKGEKFSELIFEAAQQCHVAVVILSDDYLKSKWPMLELVSFVEAQKSTNPNLKILPVFYKLRVVEFKTQLENEQLMTTWQEFATKDPRVDPTEWIGALRILSKFNGEEFAKYGGSEVAYRREIVASICKLSRPELLFDVSAMQGQKRFCDIVVKELEMRYNNQADVKPMILGLHGVGGMGKTLICKALCNYFHSEYAGRVCHVELQMNGDSTDVLKKILRDLTNISEGLLLRVTDHLQVKDLMRIWLPKRSVFLAIDNVLDVHLNVFENDLPFILKLLSPESKVIFTSRSLEILNTLLGSKALSVSLPFLLKAEALNILLQSAVPHRHVSSFDGQEMKILEMYTNCCLFSITKRNPNLSTLIVENGCYHPLALRALGSYLSEIHPSEPLEWHEKLSITGQWHLFHRRSVFDILRTGYDTLPSSLDKLLYMDVALFAPRQKLYNLKKLCDWLQCNHNLSEEAILYKLRLFQKKSLLELWNDEDTTRVVVHDLYLEFAEYEIQLEDSRRWCVYQRGAKVLPNCLESSPPGSHWPDLVRICLVGVPVWYPYVYKHDQPTPEKPILRFSNEKLKEWTNLQVLCIHCFEVEHLDVGPLKCLRSLDLQSSTLKTLTCSNNMDQLRFVKLDFVRLEKRLSFMKCFKLQELATRHYDFDHDFLPFPSRLMKVLDLSNWNQQITNVLDLGHMSSLQELKIAGNYFEWGGKFSILGLSSLSELRSLVLNRLPVKGSLPGLEDMTFLQHLSLNRCDELIRLPNLSTLTKLKILDISATGIEELEGVDKLLQLRGLYCVACRNLKSLPDLQSLPMLREVFIHLCDNLSRQPPVPEACTLVTTFAEKIIVEFQHFLYYFGKWSSGEASFREVLETCPIRAAYINMPWELIEIDQAFVEACTEMHKMAAMGRTQQEFDAEKDGGICSRLISLVTDPHATHYDLRAIRKGGIYNRMRVLWKNSSARQVFESEVGTDIKETK